MQVPPVGPTSGAVNPSEDALAQTQQLQQDLAQLRSGNESQQLFYEIQDCISALQKDASSGTLSPQAKQIISSLQEPSDSVSIIEMSANADVLNKALSDPKSFPADPTELVNASILGYVMSYVQSPYSTLNDTDFPMLGVLTLAQNCLQSLGDAKFTPQDLVKQLSGSFEDILDNEQNLKYGKLSPHMRESVQQQLASQIQQASTLCTSLQNQLGLD